MLENVQIISTVIMAVSTTLYFFAVWSQSWVKVTCSPCISSTDNWTRSHGVEVINKSLFPVTVSSLQVDGKYTPIETLACRVESMDSVMISYEEFGENFDPKRKLVIRLSTGHKITCRKFSGKALENVLALNWQYVGLKKGK